MNTLPYDDFLDLMGASGSAIGILNAAAEGATHATPEKLREIAERLSEAALNAAKHSDSYNPLPAGYKPRP
jgi:hypothetical protein